MIKIYRDDAAQSIFLENANGAQFPNSLQAVIDPLDMNKVTIIDLAKSIEIVSNEEYDQFVNENEDPYGNDGVSTVNALNVEFSASGTPTSELPVITSPLNINSVQGEIINYEMTADYGVAYEWDNLPVGLTTVDGNVRKIIGTLTTGTYTPTMRAINYNGIDQETLTINVGIPLFSNTKSVLLSNNDLLLGDPSLLSTVFARNTSGAGPSDAWTLGFWFKPSNSNNANQLLFNYGSATSGGYIRLYYEGRSNRRIRLEYGTDEDLMVMKTSQNLFTSNTWSYFMVTYDGSPTNTSNFDSHFKFYIDGTLRGISEKSGDGYSGTIPAEQFYIGSSIRNCLIGELAAWEGDQSSNANLIYNSGIPFDLSSLILPPYSWWRMGDGDIYPILQDNIGLVNLLMLNMNPSNIVNDVP